MSKKLPLFVVQKHKASHLHYDLRLEIDGVLKSWAVPKGIPTKINDKRLAVQTADHKLEYKDFSGEIPAGHYGAGTVSIWDSGNFVPFAADDNLLKSWRTGKLKINLLGKKLHGIYVLVRMQNEDNKKDWLLFKTNA